jgi:predicted nucleotidyltransferase component of viral defense system
MITKQEILDVSQITSIRPEVVEKDYVLSWILAGIHATKPQTVHWIFKGGTCLKKCYFETYRFSEDLDFTLSTKNTITTDHLVEATIKIAEWVYENSGIVIPRDSIEFKKNPRGQGSFVGKIGYVGPLSKQQGGTYKIKFDFSSDELLVLQPVIRDVSHGYSDRDPNLFKATCYAYEEVFAEKTRALAERLRPRDLYDVAHLFWNKALLTDKSALLRVLHEKCKFKGIETPTFQSIDDHAKKQELHAEWDNMLRHQLQVLPPVEHYWNELPSFFDWIYKSVEEPVPIEDPKISSGEESIWIPKIDRARPAFFGPIQKIQFAASNRLCIRLTYSNKTRTIEPLSFRKNKEERILIFSFERESNSLKSFYIDQIQKVELTDIPYHPKYPIEISATGPIDAPRIAQKNLRHGRMRS